MTRYARYQIICLPALLLLAACQTAPTTPQATPVEIAAPPLPDSARYTIDAQASEIRLLVYRGGALARFGHNHVVTGPVHGVIHAGDSLEETGFRLEVRPGELVVDPAKARTEEGEEFESQLSAEARQGTRQNMLGKDLLRADEHPVIGIASLGMSGPGWNPDVRAKVTLRGVSRELDFPAAVFFADERIVVIAKFTLLQSDFGIEPFSALGGGLRVQDEIDVRVRIVANPGAN